MTRLVLITKTGPRFHEPRTLTDQLQASVDYISEKQRQEELAACISSDRLPSDYALAELHSELDRVVSRG